MSAFSFYQFTHIIHELSQLGESVRIEVNKEDVWFASDRKATNGSVLLKQTDSARELYKDYKVKEKEEEEEEEGERKKKKARRRRRRRRRMERTSRWMRSSGARRSLSQRVSMKARMSKTMMKMTMTRVARSGRKT